MQDKTKFVIVTLLGVLLVGGLFGFNNLDSSQSKLEGKIMDEYQGPVPLGYDLDYFRKTGETIKEEVIEING